MLAGAWVLALVPLVDLLVWSGLAAYVPVVSFDFQTAFATLDESFITWIYAYLAFCIGVVLFFSKERGRRGNRLDWTRRWGVFASYCVLVLGVPVIFMSPALVLIGIAALCHSLPLENQPAITALISEIGAGYIYYGPHWTDTGDVALAVFSACAILLACVPLYDALRSSGSRVLALVLLMPLALIAVWQIGSAVLVYLHPPIADTPPPPFFFQPQALLGHLTNYEAFINGQVSPIQSILWEAAKWLPFLGIAIWLSLAQVRAWGAWWAWRKPSAH